MGTYTGNPAGGIVVTVTLPADNTDLDASGVNVVFESIQDALAWIKAALSGTAVTITLAGLVIPAGGTLEVDGVATIVGGVVLQGTAAIELNSGTSLFAYGGSTVHLSAGSLTELLGRKRGRPRVYLTDASQTIDTTQGDEFVMPCTNTGIPAAARTITLRTTTAPVPLEDETINIVLHYVAGTGQNHSIRREDGTVICTFTGIGGMVHSITAQFRFSGGVWRLGMNSGVGLYDDGPHTHYGVIPGAGA